MKTFNPVECGVYKIVNTVNGRVYVGSSLYFPERWRSHKRDLISCRHHNCYLQEDWVKYGEESFVFEMVELCSPEELLKNEELWINKLESGFNQNGYNLDLKPTTDPFQTRLSLLGKPKTLTHCKNLGIAHKGKKHTIQHKEKMIASLKAKYSDPKERAKLAAKWTPEMREQVRIRNKRYWLENPRPSKPPKPKMSEEEQKTKQKEGYRKWLVSRPPKIPKPIKIKLSAEERSAIAREVMLRPEMRKL